MCVVCVLCRVFIASFLYPITWLLYFVSALLGLGAAGLHSAFCTASSYSHITHHPSHLLCFLSPLADCRCFSFFAHLLLPFLLLAVCCCWSFCICVVGGRKCRTLAAGVLCVVRSHILCTLRDASVVY